MDNCCQNNKKMTKWTNTTRFGEINKIDDFMKTTKQTNTQLVNHVIDNLLITEIERFNPTSFWTDTIFFLFQKKRLKIVKL